MLSIFKSLVPCSADRSPATLHNGERRAFKIQSHDTSCAVNHAAEIIQHCAENLLRSTCACVEIAKWINCRPVRHCVTIHLTSLLPSLFSILISRWHIVNRDQPCLANLIQAFGMRLINSQSRLPESVLLNTAETPFWFVRKRMQQSTKRLILARINNDTTKHLWPQLMSSSEQRKGFSLRCHVHVMMESMKQSTGNDIPMLRWSWSIQLVLFYKCRCCHPVFGFCIVSFCGTTGMSAWSTTTIDKLILLVLTTLMFGDSFYKESGGQ